MLMLSIYGAGQRYCDGISRRSFLRVGSLSLGAFGGFPLVDLLRAEAAAGRGPGHKAIINIFLAGGPPHQDVWDIKTEAPSAIRGEFKPIATNVDGIQIGEAFPKIAGLADRFSFIRSVLGSAMTTTATNAFPAGRAERCLHRRENRPWGPGRDHWTEMRAAASSAAQ
jgi:hypothetical protein